MAVPFFEPNENGNNNKQQHEHHHAEEVDHVDGHIPNPITIAANQQNYINSPITDDIHQTALENEITAWKMLAVAMCKALKEHYLQNMSSSSNTSAVVHILPNGEIKPSWN